MLRRLVLLFVIFLLPACALEGEEDDTNEDVEQTEEAITAGPQWKMVTLVIRNINTSFVSGGQTVRAQGRMSTATADKAEAAARALPAKFAQWNGGRAPASMTVIDVPEAIQRVSLISQERGYWVDPNDIAAILDKYAPRGRYDSVFVAWDPTAAAPDIPYCCAWGRGPSDAANGATYAVIPPFAMDPEAMVHEWLHGAAGFYKSHGLDVPDPHENRTFGYWVAADGTWHHWYQALLRGALLREGKVVGLTSPVWRSGTPRRWVGGSYPAPPRPALGQPVMRKAIAASDHVYLEWTPVRKPSHYFEWIAILRPDGTLARNVSHIRKPGIDRGNFDYDYFTKDEICATARRAGVSLAAVKMNVEIWPDLKQELATRMPVAGTMDCR